MHANQKNGSNFGFTGRSLRSKTEEIKRGVSKGPGCKSEQILNLAAKLTLWLSSFFFALFR